MSSKQELEKGFTKEFEEEQREPYYPPPPAIPQIDMAYHQPPPPPPQPQHVFNSYPVYPRRSGIRVSVPIFVLFAMIFFFESSMLFVYTVLGLFNTLPPGTIPLSMGATGCDSAVVADHSNAVTTISTIYISSDPLQAATVFSTVDRPVTITITASTSSNLTTSTTASSTSTSSSSTSSSVKPSIETVTASPSTVTVFSTSSPSLPSITVETVLSTTQPPASTVTSIALVSAR